MPNLHQTIKRLRLQKGLSQDSLAKELDISRQTYTQIETGGRDLTVPEARKLAGVFGVSLDDFLQGRETSVFVDIKKTNKTPKPKKEEVRISVPQENVDKFRQVLLYILKKVGGKPNVGMTVLYKLLYFIDFDYYEKYEDQLMGLVYLKNHRGPTPLLFEKLIGEMVKKGEVEPIKSKFYHYPQTKYLLNPSVEPDLSILNGQEKDHIDWELQRLSDMTATDLSDFSHKDVPWITADDGKVLNYESVFYRDDNTSVRVYDDKL